MGVLVKLNWVEKGSISERIRASQNPAIIILHQKGCFWFLPLPVSIQKALAAFSACNFISHEEAQPSFLTL